MTNSVELLGYYGGDKTHCLSAWCSTFEDLGIILPPTIEDRIDLIFEEVCKTKKKTPEELLSFLAEHEHHTPFEKSLIHFSVNTDIASHIHLLKHRIGVSINSESARYKELKEDKYYLPEDWDNIKSQEESPFYNKGSEWKEILQDYSEVGNFLYHECLKDLTPVLGKKRAKESARFFKTYNSQIQADISFNFRSFMHFMKLRNSPGAQLEIKELAKDMLEKVKSLPNNPFLYSLKAFGY